LLDAMEGAIAEHGYPGTTVADVVRRAQTSRRTFYEYFTDRESCYVEMLRRHNAALIRAVSTGVDPDSPWQDQVRQAVDAWIAFGERNPAVLLSWIRDAPALGTRAHQLQQQSTESFTVMLLQLRNTEQLRAAGLAPISRERAIMLLGGLRELTAHTVEHGGRISDIRDEAVAASLLLVAP
jgi:AcrR family transcriptional regulator